MPKEFAGHVVRTHTELRETAARRNTDDPAVLVAQRSKRAEPKSPPFFQARQPICSDEHVVPQPLLDAVRQQDHLQNASGEDGQLW